MPDLAGAVERLQASLAALAAARAEASKAGQFQRWSQLNADYLRIQHQLALVRQPADRSPASGTRSADQR